MKTLTPVLFLAFAGLASAADPGTSPDVLGLTPEYRRVRVLDETALSPFRKPEARAAQAAALIKNSGPNVPSVLARFHELGLTGVIPSTAKKPGLIVLGGNVYHEGQEIAIYDAKHRGRQPLVSEHVVTLRSVTPQALALSVSHAGETEKPAINVPIGLLEFRQR